MTRHAILFAACLSSACAHDPPVVPPQPLLAEPDWGAGLDQHTPTPLRPGETDRALFALIRRLQERRLLGTPDADAELAPLLAAASQTMLAASALELYRAGVCAGSPSLMNQSCAASRRVEHPGLRRANRLRDLEAACAALALSPEELAARPCGASTAQLVEAYRLLASSEERAREVAGAALRARAECSQALPLRRTPVAPTAPGFIVVAALQAVGADPVTWLAGEGTPNTASSINTAFVENVKLLP